jgi:predicted GNAT family acetyltransferase
MEAHRFDDPASFLHRAAPLLETSEPRHNLIYGIAGTLVSEPDVYPEFRLWMVEDAGVPVAAALRTPPYNVVVADARDPAAADVLVAVVAADDPAVPGAAGTQPTIGRFAETWRRIVGTEVHLRMAQGVFALDQVRLADVPAGRSRPAKEEDRDLLVGWFEAFIAEALPDEPSDRERLIGMVERQIAGGSRSGIWLWERDGDPVAMSAYGGPTPHGIRIGPVYTPPRHRRLGYASAVVAEQSAWLLAAGRRFCFLYTDLANPTSNAIYQRIGYRQVAEAADYGFGSTTV